jgi:hypothetical protein
MAGRFSVFAGLAFVLLSRSAVADGANEANEPVGAGAPRIMNESAEVTTVADAFDKDNPFDLNLVLGITQSYKHANIRRETQLAQPGLATGNFIPATENVASYNSTMSTLMVGADVGLYHDLALVLRLPIILSWTQSLDDLDGSAAVAATRLADPAGGQLFTVPFKSPTRSGIDYVSVGLDWAIENQERDWTKPTWVVGVEGHIAVGTPLHACNATSGTIVCPSPQDPSVGRTPGISRGMDAIVVKSLWSRRFGMVTPYAGFSAQAEFPRGDSDFGQWDPSTTLDRSPPLLGSFALGLEIIPYEVREQFQRFSADFRVKGTYHSPGRDYSELFDALGSSQAASLRTPNPAAYTAGTTPGSSVVDKTSEPVYFAGITEEDAYGSLYVSASATWQTGEYIKFTAGSAFTYAGSHLATTAAPCTPGNTSLAAAGPCYDATTGAVLGAPNPDHRDIIDLPGHRFSIDDTTIVDLWVTGAVMF